MFDNLRMEHTQQGQGNSIQIFINIPEDWSASVHKLNIWSKCSSVLGGCGQQGLNISFPGPLPAPSFQRVHPIPSTEDLAPGTLRCLSQCTRHITAEFSHDKALPRSRFWPNLPALAGWKEGTNKMMNTGKGYSSPCCSLLLGGECLQFWGSALYNTSTVGWNEKRSGK